MIQKFGGFAIAQVGMIEEAQGYKNESWPSVNDWSKSDLENVRGDADLDLKGEGVVKDSVRLRNTELSDKTWKH